MMGDRITDRRPINFLDASDDKTDLTGAQAFAHEPLRRKHTDLIDEVRSTGRLYQDALTTIETAVDNAHQRHDAEIIVEPGINDQGLKGCLGIACRRRHQLHQLLEQRVNALARFGTDLAGVAGLNTDDVFDFATDPLRFRLRQVHFVKHRYDFQAHVNGGITIGNRLSFYPLRGVDNQ